MLKILCARLFVVPFYNTKNEGGGGEAAAANLLSLNNKIVK